MLTPHRCHPAKEQTPEDADATTPLSTTISVNNHFTLFQRIEDTLKSYHINIFGVQKLFRFLYVTPNCFVLHMKSFQNLEDRFFHEPNKCVFDQFGKIASDVGTSVDDVRKSYVTLQEIVDRLSKHNQMFALVSLVAKEKEYVDDFVGRMNFIFNRTLGMVGVPRCFVDETEEVVHQVRFEWNNTIECCKRGMS